MKRRTSIWKFFKQKNNLLILKNVQDEKIIARKKKEKYIKLVDKSKGKKVKLIST